MTLLELRTKYGLSQKDMANILDTSQSSYSRIEKRDIKHLTLAQLIKISYITDIDLDALIEILLRKEINNNDNINIKKINK